jgi:DNA-binding transcriptional ArsR family regulator
MSDAFEAVASPRRRQILSLVWGAERSAGEIAEAMSDVTFGAVSQHLKLLTEAGLVTRREKGRSRLYRARPEALGPVRDWLQSMWGDALERLKERAEKEAGISGQAICLTPLPPLHGHGEGVAVRPGVRTRRRGPRKQKRVTRRRRRHP